MYEEPKAGMQCLEFENLLSDALEGTITAADRNRFDEHRESCPSCGPMFAEARMGMQWLHGLQEIEPPANFVHNVLAATTGRMETATPAGVQRPSAPAGTWWARLKAGARPVLGPVLQPKIAMSFAMVFFSISLVLNLAGVKIGDLHHVDLSPNAIVRGAYEAQGRVVKYYENIRFVYEIESRVQELKRATAPEDNPAPAEEKEKDRKDHSGNPDPKQYRNYSREQEAVTMARLFQPDQVFARRNS